MLRGHRRNRLASVLAWVVVTAITVVTPATPVVADETRQIVRFVRSFDLDELGLSSPAGLAFSETANEFYVIETSIPGSPAGSTTDLVGVSPFEEHKGFKRLAAQVTDRINVTFDAVASRLLFYTSHGDKLVEVPADALGNLDPQNLVRHSAGQLGLVDPQGLAVDPATGHLFILDAGTSRIARIEPESSGSFANAAASSFDISAVGLADPVGLAIDPTTGHLHIVSPSQQSLYELDQTGSVVTVRDLSDVTLANPQAIVFAPSGDLTDDPSQMSLYLADGGFDSDLSRDALTTESTLKSASTTGTSGQLIELSLVDPPAATAATTSFTSSHIQTINAFDWTPPSPDSSGIVYLPASNNLLVVDGEVNEMPIYAGANVFESTLNGALTGTFTTLDFGSNEPTGASVNPANGHLFISQDTPPKLVWEIDPGPDGQYDTTDDIVTSIVTADFGSMDPEGVTFAAGLGHLFIADGLNNEIYQLSPGNNGVFDGVAPAGDDQLIAQFDTFVHGMEDPEGVAYNPDSGNLYVAGKTRNIGSWNFDTLLEVTTGGALVQTIDVSAANPGRAIPKQKLSGLAYGPSSQDPNARVIWIADRGVDNNSDPNENDGRIYEMTLPGNPAAPPTAVDDSAVTAQDSAVVVDVAVNDSDPNGNLDPASANSVCANGSAGCLGAGNGSLTDGSDGTITYLPDPGFTGSDSFVYEICDTDVLCDSTLR